MGTPKISLVFPCWHAAKHMPHVLEDLQAQTFPDFEAILVNDGDDSQVEAMEQIAAKDHRIRIVYRKENGGLAAARNSGTDAVTTPWVTYPDPDDRFGPNYVRSLFEAVDGTGVEMACGGYCRINVETKICTSCEIKIAHPLECADIASGYERMLADQAQRTVWNKVYSVMLMREKGLKQDESFKVGQDLRFNISYYPHVKRVALVKDCDYKYQAIATGLSNSTKYDPNFMANMKEINELFVIFHRQIGWCEQRVMDNRRNELVGFIRKLFVILFFSNAHLTVKEAMKKLRKDLFDQPENVAVIVQGHFGDNRLLQLIKIVTYTHCACLAVIVFKMLALFAMPKRVV